jgi:DNA repair protein RecN (Recombination protein N)
LKELEAAPLKEGILEELEGQYEQLNNVEVILDQLSKGHQILNDEQVGVVGLLTELKSISNKLSAFGSPFAGLNERIQSVFIEVDDIASELFSIQEKMEPDPELLDQVNGKLQLLYDLQKKHHAGSIEELIAVKSELSEKVSAVENIEAQIKAKQDELLDKEKQLTILCNDIGKRRKSAIPLLKKQLEATLATLGMPNSTFKIEIAPSKEFKASGKDDLTFLFSANKGMDFGELKKVASGGELSRIMLTIKSTLAKYEQLPTLMFDEIDSGVSGEISNKMGDIMKRMSQSMQIFSITHLPQVASRGDHHFKVFKEDDGKVTHTKMKKLGQEERVLELAEMLGGKALTNSAMAHARQLLN